MKYYIVFINLVLSFFILQSCEDFLDKAPDEDLTLEDVFSNEQTTERFLASVYYNLPWEMNFANDWGENPFVGASDEMDLPFTDIFSTWMNMGAWSADNVPQDIWDMSFRGIRKANIFIENIEKAPINENKKKEWKGEAIFLRAFFHFQLLRIYGPMNVYENALKPNEDFTSILSQRIPLEKCTDFIINECDRAAEMLPIKIDPVKFNQYAGHATKAASMALKARVLLYLASPLWNGNPDYANFTNKEGENLFPKEYDENKWQKAASYTKQAIDELESAGYGLFFSESSDPLKNYRDLFLELHNKEILFARNFGAFAQIEQIAGPNGMGGWSGLCPTQGLIDAYQMADGSTPITNYDNNGQPVINPNSGYQEKGFTTEDSPKGYYLKDILNMYANREPRFYASITYNNSFWRTRRVDFAKDGVDGRKGGSDYTTTGYLMRKFLDEGGVNLITGRFTNKTWIFFRLGELYLNYAEALNEAQGPIDDVYKYVDAIRNRSGLPGLPTGLSKDEMRDQIRHERRIELAFETHRYFDCHRWKIAQVTDNGPIYGMNINASGTDFYSRTKVEDRVFESPKHYLWPIYQNEINKALELFIQNPGW
jgi:hypothetical protein